MTKFIKNNKSQIFFIIIVLLPLAYLGITTLPIIIWDEAIYANNALEMAISGNPLVLKVNGISDLYNTKPPFVIWCQSICIRLFGGSELAIRLPSLLSCLGLALMVSYFLKKNFGNSQLGIISVLALFTSMGYMRNHVALTGDLDAMLVFWVSFFSLPLFHLALNTKTNIKKVIYLGGFGFLLAYMTKSTAALLPLPGLFLILLISRQLKYIFLDKRFYAASLGIIGSIITYYLLREYISPDGYWEKVYFSEFKRYTHEVMSWHVQPFEYYFKNLITKEHFTPHIYILPFCLLLGFLNPNSKIKKLTLYAFIFVLIYLLIISFPSVKLDWYDAPIYPFLSIIVGIGIYSFLERFIKHKNKMIQHYLQVTIISLLFIYPYYQVIKNNCQTKIIYPQDQEGYTIKELKKLYPQEKSYKVLMEYPEVYNRHIDQGNFYIRSFNHFENYDIKLSRNQSELNVGDKILVCQNEVQDSLSSKYETLSIHKNEFCSFIKLENLKDSSTK